MRQCRQFLIYSTFVLHLFLQTRCRPSWHPTNTDKCRNFSGLEVSTKLTVDEWFSCLDEEQVKPLVHVNRWHVFTVGRPVLLIRTSSTCPFPLQSLSGTQNVSFMVMTHQQILLHNQNKPRHYIHLSTHTTPISS